MMSLMALGCRVKARVKDNVRRESSDHLVSEAGVEDAHQSSSARVKCKEKINKRIWITMGGKNYWQPVNMLTNIIYCDFCCIRGHVFSNYKKKPTINMNEADDRVQVQVNTSALNQSQIVPNPPPKISLPPPLPTPLPHPVQHLRIHH